MPNLPYHKCLAVLLALATSVNCTVGIAADIAPVFEQDFSVGSSALDNWRSKHRLKFRVVEGVLIGDNDGDTYGVGIGSPKFSVTDLRAAFRFQVVDAKGVQFKLNYVKGGHIGRFIIQRNGFFFQANKNRPLTITEAKNFETQAADVAPKSWHEFVIEKRGDKITGTLNGDVSMSYRYEPLRHTIGQFELSVTGSVAMFDDIVITSLAPTPADPSGRGGPTSQSTTKKVPRAIERVRTVGGKGVTTTARQNLSDNWHTPLSEFLSANCADCHMNGGDEGNLDLDTLSTNLGDAETLRRWVVLFDRVHEGEMPPKDYDLPDPESRRSFLASLSSSLTLGDAAHREVILRRLNRVEYENTVNDLFGIDVKLAGRLPQDASRDGFDNVGEALTMSAELIETYLDVAETVLDRVFGPREVPKRVSIDASLKQLAAPAMYNRWGKLLETDDGSVVFSSNFGAGSQLVNFKAPSEGTYRVRIHADTYQTDKPVIMQIQTGVVTRSGVKRFIGHFNVPPGGRIVEFTDYMNVRDTIYPRPFNTINNIASFQQKDYSLEKLRSFDGAGLKITRIEIEGPIDAWPPPSRSMLLGEIDLERASAGDAHAIFARLLPRAFRRPVEPDEITRYADKADNLMAQGRSFEDALRWTLRAALCSAEFLFLEEPLDVRNHDRLNDFALASRLSYYLWSSMPDKELLQLATEGKLHDPATLRQQTERLLNDPRSSALVSNFAHQWLDLREIDATSPDTKLYPEFDDYLKDSMVRETELFFETVLRKNLSVREFIDSDWVIVNERLAEHYELQHPGGEEFVRVSLPKNSVRGGLMTQASVLKVTANGANTSPVVRGVWMLENIMGIHPPPPPPNVPAVVPDVSGAQTLRQLLETHRGEESCNACHRKIDPPGFALEEFDAVGKWRTTYRFQGSRKLLPVDSSGETPTGESFQDVRAYKSLIVDEVDQVTRGLTSKLLTYATGRPMGFSDRKEIDDITDGVAQTDYAFRDLIHATVQSGVFRRP